MSLIIIRGPFSTKWQVSEVISPSGNRSPNHNPLEEILSDLPGLVIGQGPGGPERKPKTLKRLVYPSREALRRLPKPS